MLFNIHQFKESCLNDGLVSMACSPSGSRGNPWELWELAIVGARTSSGAKTIRGQGLCRWGGSAGRVGVSAAGLLCRAQRGCAGRRRLRRRIALLCRNWLTHGLRPTISWKDFTWKTHLLKILENWNPQFGVLNPGGCLDLMFALYLMFLFATACSIHIPGEIWEIPWNHTWQW